MRKRALILLGCILISSFALHRQVKAAGVGISVPGHVSAGVASADTFLFFPWRDETLGSLMGRDLEFSLSANYSRTRGDATPGLTIHDHTTLLNFAKSIVETVENPFGAPYPDIQLVHDYFSSTGAVYNTNPNASGFLPPGNPTYSDADRAHVDHYIFEPGLDGFYDGRHPSTFKWQKEDSTTGWWISSTNNTVLEQNSTSFPGPSLSGIQDLAGTGWTRPDATANWGTIHEIQHYFNNDTGAAMSELFSTAAEVLSGSLPGAAAAYDVNYTWSLFDNFTPNPMGTGVTHTSTNYAAWRLLSAYLLTNFRNQDTTATLPGTGSGGLADDLVYRWARKLSRTPGGLSTLLSDDSCYTCSQKAAFHPGGTSLSNLARLNVLMHNWRIANFVNNPFLEPDADGAGMYGYPPQFGFSPTQDVGAWADNDTASGAYNVLVFPAEVTARPAWLSRDTVISVSRSREGAEYPLRLRPVGSEYWTIRSTGDIPAGKELVVRVAADSIFWRTLDGSSPYTCPGGIFFGHLERSGNLMASLVGYTGQSDSLWDEGGSAATVIGPVAVDIDSLAGEIELVLPGFGSTYEAAVLVLTSGFGPVGGLANESGFSDGSQFYEATRYRLNLALRDTSAADVNPRMLVASAAIEDHPSWSPDGTEIVYIAATAPYAQIYRVASSGGTPSLLVGGAGHQRTPEWSPRGDYIIYVEEVSDTATTILRYRVEDPEVEPLTTGTTQAVHPAISPNGQSVAYARRTPGLSTWSLRSVGIDGTGDAALSSTVHANPISSIRWSADGSVVYYVSGERLHGVTLSGGSSLQLDEVAVRLGSFDLPRGSGRILLEEIGATKYYCDGANQFAPFRRLALRDTTASPRDTEMRFYRTNANFYSPRYSPDGRFVAYRSDQNAMGGGDLFVGQLVWDRAPVFDTTLTDRTVWDGQGVTIDLRATDPDGDEVLYSAAHLPAGASIVNGYFLWPDPTTTGSPYHVTLRAGSAGGAVVSQVVRIDVTPRPVAVSDLVLATGRYSGAIAWSEPAQPLGAADSYDIRYHSGGTTISESNFASGTPVSYSGSPGTEGTEHCVELDLGPCTGYSFAVRTIRDGVPSFLSNVAAGSTQCSGTSLVECAWDGLFAGGGGGEGSLRRGGTELTSTSASTPLSEGLENTLLGGARGTPGSDLMPLPGDPGLVDGEYVVRVHQSASNQVEIDQVTLGFVDHIPALDAVAGTNEVLLGTASEVAAVVREDDRAIEPGQAFMPGDVVLVDPGAATDALLLALSGPGVRPSLEGGGVDVQVPDGSSWKSVGHAFTRRHAVPQAIDVEGASRVRLVFGSAARLESVRRFEVASRARPTALALASATHAGGSDVAADIASRDEARTVLDQGQDIVLAFEAAEVPAGLTRSLFLGASGMQIASEGVEARSSNASQATEPVSFQFSLGAAKPNPTTGRVSISYTLARPAAARVRVYGVTGRLVRTLVEIEQEAGPHEVVWDGRTNTGAPAGPGVYFYRLEAGDFRSERKVVVIRE